MSHVSQSVIEENCDYFLSYANKVVLFKYTVFVLSHLKSSFHLAFFGRLTKIWNVTGRM